MRILKIALFLVLCIWASISSAGTKFGFLYSGADKSSFEFKRINGYFNKIDTDIRAGIRFGVDRLIDIEFEPSTSLVKRRDGKIIIDSKVKESILSYKTRDRKDGISLRDHLLRRLEQELLKLEGADDMERAFTLQEVKDIDHCYLKRKAGNRGKGLRNFRLHPAMKKRCEELDELKERRRNLEWYNTKVSNLAYRVKLEFDPTSLTDQTLKKYNICNRPYKPTKINSKGKRVKALGMAIIYMAPGYDTSVAGHVAERYVYCLENKLMDIMFEYTQMTAGELQNMKSVYKKYAEGASEDYIKSLEGKIYMKIRTNPASTATEGYGFFQYYNNRDIIEVWPKSTEMETYDGLQVALQNYKKQKEHFINRTPFEDYSLLDNNCTHPIRDRLEKINGGEYDLSNVVAFNPIWLFGALKKKNAEKMIIYPSQRMLRKMRMLEKGHSLFWENSTFWSKASEGTEGLNGANMLIYPETHGLLKSVLYRPAAAAINFTAATLETLYGILTTPLKWLAKIPGFKWLEPKRDHLGLGIKGMALSVVEFTGFRLRYPKATPWTEEEEAYLFEELPESEPKVLDFLLEKVQE